MKTIPYLYTSLCILTSCSGTKKIKAPIANIDYETYENEYFYRKSNNKILPLKNKIAKFPFDDQDDFTPEKEVIISNGKIDATIYKIIQEYTGNKPSEINRYLIFKTKNGYEWKFTNIKTKLHYKIETNQDFEDVHVTTLSAISDF